MDWSIRDVRETDAASIVALLNPIIDAGIYTAMEGPLTVADQVAFVRGLPERGVYHVAVAAGSDEAIGIPDVLPAEEPEGASAVVGEISTFVGLGWHRRGIGRALCEATFRAAIGKGYRRLVATIRSDNRQAVEFYRAMGFEVVGTAPVPAGPSGERGERVIAERWLEGGPGPPAPDRPGMA